MSIKILFWEDGKAKSIGKGTNYSLLPKCLQLTFVDVWLFK